MMNDLFTVTLTGAELDLLRKIINSAGIRFLLNSPEYSQKDEGQSLVYAIETAIQKRK